MRSIRQKTKPVSVILAIWVLFLTVPCQSVLAAMIETETALDSMTPGQEARNFIKSILAREDVQAALNAQGIDPTEAKARVDSLSDTEATRLADQIEHLPAGGGFISTFIVIVGVIFIVLIITDLLGYTDIFTFVR